MESPQDLLMDLTRSTCTMHSTVSRVWRNKIVIIKHGARCTAAVIALLLLSQQMAGADEFNHKTIPGLQDSKYLDELLPRVLRNTALINDSASGLRTKPVYSLLPRGTANACVIVQNDGAKTIRRFEFAISYFDSRRKQIGFDRLIRSYTIGPGESGGTPPPFPSLARMDCVRIGNELLTPGVNAIFSARFVLRRVDYDDDTFWTNRVTN
jgi:hypothetical protein